MNEMIAIILLVFASCCSNVVFLELLIRKDAGCGNLITFSQFFFVALQGFILSSNFGMNKPNVPFKNYIFLVSMFFSVSVANNYALNFNIPMPLHMIFRSGSLVTNMILGMIILKRRYSLRKYFSVLMITIGIFIATIASQEMKKNSLQIFDQQQKILPVAKHTVVESLIDDQTNKEKKMDIEIIQSEDTIQVDPTILEVEEEKNANGHTIFYALAGVSLLTFALFVSAGLGIYQEIIYEKFGKHPQELLYYSHALPLPGFILLINNIYLHSQIFSNSEPVLFPVIGNIPIMWMFLVGNVLTQYICVRSVFTLSTKFSSLTVTLVITLRKFVSLIFSVVYFKNPFTTSHWVATFLVFSGTLLFTDITKLFRQKIKHS